MVQVQVKSLHLGQVAHQARAYPGLLIFFFSLDGMLVHRRVSPVLSLLICVHLYTWAERVTVRNDSILLSKSINYNAIFLATARTWTVQPGDKHTNHEATMPPTLVHVSLVINDSSFQTSPHPDRTITQYKLLILLCSNHLLKCIMLYNV